MMGRRIGTVGNEKATAYIEREVRRMGLEPAGDSGTYFQDIHPDSSARFNGHPPPRTARNVVAILRGSDPVLRNEYVAIGAHNDHIGIRATPADYDSLRARHCASRWAQETRGRRCSSVPSSGASGSLSLIHISEPTRPY